MDALSFDNTAASNSNSDRIFLVGHPRTAWNCMSSALTSEFPDVSIQPVAALDQIDCEDARVHSNTTLLIVHHSHFDELVSIAPKLIRAKPKPSIAIAFEDDAYARQCWMTSGSMFDGFLSLNVRLDIWLSTIRLLLAGAKYVEPSIFTAGLPQPNQSGLVPEPMSTPPKQSNEDAKPVLDCLTARESQVLALVAQGRQNKLIAAELDLSENTVKLHMHHIISKLGVTNRTEAAALFINEMPPNPEAD